MQSSRKWLIAVVIIVTIIACYILFGHGDQKPTTIFEPIVSHDGKQIVYGVDSDKGTVFMSFDLGARKCRQIYKTSESAGSAVFTSDDKRILFSVVEGSKKLFDFGKSQLYIMSADGGNAHRLITSDFSDDCPTIASNGQDVLFIRSGRKVTHSAGVDRWTDDDIYRTDFNGINAIPMTHRKYNDLAGLAIEADNRTLIYCDDRLVGNQRDQIYDLDMQTGVERRLTNGYRYSNEPVISRKSSKIAFISDQHDPFDYEVWCMGLDGKGARQVTQLNRNCSSPIFSPDGKSIVFNVEDGEIWRVNIDGTWPEQLPIFNRDCSSPSFLPDGKSIVFVVDDRELWRVNIDGTGLAKLPIT